MDDRAPKTFLLHDDGTFPNHPKWPLLIYPAALSFSSEDPVEEVERVFRQNGWSGTWRNSIYSFHHYHSNAHEVLGVFRGNARVQFGGPKGVEIELQSGDVAILPAGTAHRNLGCSGDFGVVGAYPPRPQYDLCRGTKEERAKARENISRVARPAADPVFGKGAGLCEFWKEQ
jgi:uncharacterized protein YjlB